MNIILAGEIHWCQCFSFEIELWKILKQFIFPLLFKVGDFSVSLKAPGRNKHFRVHVEGTLYCIGQRKFASLQQLVEHYQRAPIYTSQKGEKLFLIRPLPKWTQLLLLKKKSMRYLTNSDNFKTQEEKCMEHNSLFSLVHLNVCFLKKQKCALFFFSWNNSSKKSEENNKNVLLLNGCMRWFDSLNDFHQKRAGTCGYSILCQRIYLDILLNQISFFKDMISK